MRLRHEMNGKGAGRDDLTVEQAASYLQLSQSSIRSYIRSGKLKAFPDKYKLPC
jgi:predicted DNA-binding transcriptional regulator AlpA